MKLVLDTSSYSLCCSENYHALDLVEQAQELFMPAIVYGELYYGFRHGKKFEHNLRILDLFIAKFAVEIIVVDVDVSKKFGDIFASLRRKGRPIPTNDIWIAASCMSVGGVLLSADRHFHFIEQIQSEFLDQ